ncbi:MAG: 2-oxoacid:ferredoxin oxidoreductase subunit beta [Nitrospinota bacterium]|nr:2-oxoacid:ferredoxin oxidoreductase subunit beta [Nitrospinota bacterium]
MTTATVPLKAKDYKNDIRVVWCPGCGDYGVLSAVQKAYAELQLSIENTVAVSGIGCSSRLPYFLKTYGFHSLHGRALPVATGIKLGNPNLEVIAFGGDGDGFSIGGGHVPHVVRKNTDITYILMDNHIYGLTKGQVSPTSDSGFVSVTTPYGSPDTSSVNPLSYVLTYGATFVGQAFSGNPKQMAELIKQAIEHKGFSFVNIISPCLTFNKVDTFDYYKERVIELPADHKSDDLVQALDKAINPPLGQFYTGLFYKAKKPTLVENLQALNKKVGGNKNYDLNIIMDEYKP